MSHISGVLDCLSDYYLARRSLLEVPLEQTKCQGLNLVHGRHSWGYILRGYARRRTIHSHYSRWLVAHYSPGQMEVARRSQGRAFPPFLGQETRVRIDECSYSNVTYWNAYHHHTLNRPCESQHTSLR